MMTTQRHSATAWQAQPSFRETLCFGVQSFASTEQEKQRHEEEGFAPPHVIAISSAGPLFTSLVVENFNRDKITASDVSDYLQIRLKHLKELQGEFVKEA